MKRLALAFAIALAVSPAFAGKIILTLRTDASNIFKGDITLPDAAVRRIIDAYRGLYYPNGVVETPAVLNPDGTVQTPAVMRPATEQEVVLKMANGIGAGLRANAKRSEQDAVAKTAADTVTDLPADPAIP